MQSKITRGGTHVLGCLLSRHTPGLKHELAQQIQQSQILFFSSRLTTTKRMPPILSNSVGENASFQV